MPRERHPHRRKNDNHLPWKIGGAGLIAAIIAALQIWSHSDIAAMRGDLKILRRMVSNTRADQRAIEREQDEINQSIAKAVARGIVRGRRQLRR